MQGRRAQRLGPPDTDAGFRPRAHGADESREEQLKREPRGSRSKVMWHFGCLARDMVPEK